MCGIVYAHDFKGRPVNNGVLNQYDKQKHRGQEGFGLFDGQETHIKKHSKEDGILKWLVKYPSNLLLFHHRYPTSTINVKRAAHPFSTKDYFGDNQYVLVHNGSIRNAEELFCDHQELGIEYQSLLEDLTFNDSEALMWDFALTMEGKQKELKAEGAIAFICLKLVKGELKSMYFGRNSSPLNMFRHDDGIMLSSEGVGEEIAPNQLYTFSYVNHRVFVKPFTIPAYTYKGTANSGFHNNWDNNTGYQPTEYTGASTAGYNSWDDDYYDGYPRDDYVPKWLRDLRLDEAGRKFLSGASDPGKTTTIDYTETESGMYVPATPEQLEELETYTPLSTEVDKAVFQYLLGVHGHFESAYWAIECDYNDLSELTDSPEVLKERRLLEACLDTLSRDEEYVNENSVSSLWSAVWQQQQLLRA
jgi:hypothetical protein